MSPLLRPLAAAVAAFTTYAGTALAANPIGGSTPAEYVPGMADPNLHYFDGKFTMWATHDFSVNNTGFLMRDWWIWSSPDLVKWMKESIVVPTVMTWDKVDNECWATDAAWVNNTYFFYVSAGPGEVGVMSAPSLKGPWKDPLGKPLLSTAFGKSLRPPATFRDPCVFQDPDTNDFFIIAGVFTYYVTKLSSDMISLAEAPRLVNFTTPTYGPCGAGQTDDKPFLHKNGDIFYLSWGCFYATSKSVYGPYAMQGAAIDKAMIAPDFQCDGQPHQCGKASTEQQLATTGTESARARAEALAPYNTRGPAVTNLPPSPAKPMGSPAAGDPIVLWECSNASAGRANWVTVPANPASGTPFSIHPASNDSLCVSAPSGSVGTGMTLEPCSGEGDGGGSVPSRVGDAAPATLVQKFQRVTPPQPNQGDDVQGVGVPNGCPCWNVRDNNAHTGASNHGVNGMVVQVSRSTALSVLYALSPSLLSLCLVQ